MAEAFIKSVGSDARDLNEADFQKDDGLWYCGKCKEPLQKIISLPIEGFERRVVRRACKCDRDRYAEEDRQRKFRENQQRVEKLRSMSLMDDKFRDSTFDHFEINQHNARTLKICKRYADAFDDMQRKNQGMIFWGNPGTGKTFAAACIANALLENQRSVVMTSFVKMISEIRNYREGYDEESIIDRLNRVSLLIIDDLGAERSTDYALERVYNIVDSRYRAKKPMLLTTNLSLKEMQSTQDIRYARIYERIFEVCYPVEFTGESWRYAIAANRYDEMKALLEGE